jgi:outer membrane biosynthesis protein TonB
MTALGPLCAAALLLSQALTPLKPVTPIDPGAAQGQKKGDEPHNTQLVVRKAPKRPFYERAADAVTSAARRLFYKEEPHAAAGNLKVAQGEYEGAMGDYDAAEKVAHGEEAEAALAYNRSAALLKGPADAAPKALDQAIRAMEGSGSDKELRSKAAYHAALALESAGKTEEAMKAYAHALSLDPSDVDSKVNLELLLRSEEERKQQQKGDKKDDQQKKDPQDQKDQQQAQKKQGEQKDEKDKQDPKDGQKPPEDKQQQANQQPDPKQGEEKPQDQGEKKQEQQPDKQGEQQQQAQDKKDEQQKEGQQKLGRSEAQRLLDAAKNGEKNLQTWRFGKKPEQHKRHVADKDW